MWLRKEVKLSCRVKGDSTGKLPFCITATPLPEQFPASLRTLTQFTRARENSVVINNISIEVVLSYKWYNG